jgi:PAS domain S-box-containing protein
MDDAGKPMSTAGRGGTDDRSPGLLASIARSDVGDHACAVCGTREEGLLTASLLVAEALGRDGRCVFVGDQVARDAVTVALRSDGIEADAAVASGALEFVEGASDASYTLALEGVGGEERASATVVVRDMASILAGSAGAEEVLEREAFIDVMHPGAGACIVCVYDRETFHARAIRDVIYSHPLIILGGEVRENFHFTPPEELLSPERLDLTVEGLLESLETPERRSGRRSSSARTAEVYRRMETANSLLAKEVARRAQTERRLRESEQLYRTLIEMSPDAVFVHSGGVLVFVNQSAAEMVGAEGPDDVLGMPVLGFVHADSKATVAGRVKWMLETGKPAPLMEERFVRLDGTAFYCDVLASPLVFTGRPSIQVVMRDVTERKNDAEDLEFRSFLLDRATDSIVVQDAETGVALYVNEAACSLRGHTREELLARSKADWVPKDHARLTIGHRKRLMNDGRVIYETRIRCKDGTDVPVEVHSSVIEHLGRKVVVSVGRDVSERKHAEATIEQMAFYDPLTGLANRTLFLDRLSVGIAQARRGGNGLAVMFLDVDHFKTINDTIGHAVGDELLEGVAARLGDLVRTGDTVARLGGDEFTLLLPGVNDEDEAPRGDAAAVRPERERDTRHGQHRRRASRRRGRRLVASEERGHRDVSRQGDGQEQLPVLHALDARERGRAVRDAQ